MEFISNNSQKICKDIIYFVVADQVSGGEDEDSLYLGLNDNENEYNIDFDTDSSEQTVYK